MKKTFRLVALLAAVALLGAGCAGGSEGAGTATSLSPDQEGQLVVWHYFKTPGQVEALAEMATLFNAKYPNVEVVYEEQPFEQMTSNLLAAAAAESGPDAIIYQWGEMLKLVEAAGLTSMEPYFSSWSEADTIPASVVHRVTGVEYDPSGEAYTINPYVNLIALYYNADILNAVGIEPPTTLDELEEALAEVTAQGHGGLVVDWRPGVGGWWGGMPWMWNNGVDITMSPDQRDTIESVLADVRSWVENGYVPADVVTFDQQTAMVQWLAGNFAFTVNGNWELTRVKDEATAQWGVVPIPAGPEGTNVYLGGEGVAIGAFSEQPELAWEYLATSWLSPEGQISLVSSVGSIPVRSDVADDPSIKDAPELAAFLAEVPNGRRLPITQAENEAQTLFGDTWSAVISGQLTPAEAADRLVAETGPILGGG